MSAFQISSLAAPPPISPVRPVEGPKPPKTQSDHDPVNAATSSRGPAVVLSGALAKGADKHGQHAKSDTPSSGQHLNHVT